MQLLHLKLSSYRFSFNLPRVFLGAAEHEYKPLQGPPSPLKTVGFEGSRGSEGPFGKYLGKIGQGNCSCTT